MSLIEYVRTIPGDSSRWVGLTQPSTAIRRPAASWNDGSMGKFVPYTQDIRISVKTSSLEAVRIVVQKAEEYCEILYGQKVRPVAVWDFLVKLRLLDLQIFSNNLSHITQRVAFH